MGGVGAVRGGLTAAVCSRAVAVSTPIEVTSTRRAVRPLPIDTAMSGTIGVPLLLILHFMGSPLDVEVVLFHQGLPTRWNGTVGSGLERHPLRLGHVPNSQVKSQACMVSAHCDSLRSQSLDCLREPLDSRATRQDRLAD